MSRVDSGVDTLVSPAASDTIRGSPVWLVVIDGQVYLRLGSRAAGRIERNTTKPIIKVKVAGEQFDRVRGEPAPEMAERVAAAMGEKYTSDIFVRYFSHPLTLRLVPEAP